jgi:hypothetical protein
MSGASWFSCYRFEAEPAAPASVALLLGAKGTVRRSPGPRGEGGVQSHAGASGRSCAACRRVTIEEGQVARLGRGAAFGAR